jgi:hypothetical protein
MLEIDEHQRVAHLDRFEECVQHGTLVFAVHDPGGAVIAKGLIDVVLGLGVEPGHPVVTDLVVE